jgi:hypothetical protein
MIVRLVQQAALLAFPHGGQQAARRNAFDRVEENLVAANVRAEAIAATQLATNRRTASSASSTAKALRNVVSG